MKAAILGLFLLPGIAHSQYFQTTGKGDLLAGFRKTGGHVGAYEMVVLLGNVTNLIALPVNTQTNFSIYGTNVLASAFASSNSNVANLSYLQWSVFSSFKAIGLPEGPWVTPVGSFPKATCWYTLPRATPNTQSQPLPPDSS